MTVEWDEVFGTGNETVDNQHRYFLELINRIEKHYKESKSEAYCRKLISELEKYADFHFTSEENIATALKLPGVGAHHERHAELLEEFEKYADRLKNKTLTIEAFIHFLTEWLTGHTYHEDQMLFKKQI